MSVSADEASRSPEVSERKTRPHALFFRRSFDYCCGALNHGAALGRHVMAPSIRIDFCSSASFPRPSRRWKPHNLKGAADHVAHHGDLLAGTGGGPLRRDQGWGEGIEPAG